MASDGLRFARFLLFFLLFLFCLLWILNDLCHDVGVCDPWSCPEGVGAQLPQGHLEVLREEAVAIAHELALVLHLLHSHTSWLSTQCF